MQRIIAMQCGKFATKKPDDFVISTGKQYTIKQFVNKVADRLKLKLKWVGTGLKEKAIDKNTNKIIIELDKNILDHLMWKI